MPPPPLRNIGSEASRAIVRATNHHLNLGYRQAIWSQLGPRSDADHRLSPPHLKRIRLAVLSVELVLPLWERRFGTNRLPQDALALISSYRKGQTRTDVMLSKVGPYWSELEQLSDEYPATEVAVGFGAVQAIGTALQDEFFDSEDID